MSNTRVRPARESDTRQDRKWKETVSRFIDGHDFDLSERPLGELWIDGSPIARKVIDIGVLPNTTTNNVAHGLDSIANVTRLYGIAHADSYTIPLPFVHTSSVREQVSIYLDTTNVVIVAGSDRSSYSGYVIIEYIKS